MPESRGSRRFAHALIREAIYQEIGPSDRRRLHAGIAAAIENRYGKELKPHLAALGHHFLEAEIPEKAIDYLIRAGDAALAVYAFDGAISHWEKALALFEEHGGDVRRKADLLENLGFTLYQVDDKKGLGLLEEALSLYERVGDEARAAQLHVKLGHIQAMAGPHKDLPRALVHYRRAESLLSQGTQTETLVPRVYAGLGQVAREQFRVREALEYTQRSMEAAEREGANNEWCVNAAAFSLHLLETGRIGEAQKLAEEVRARIPAMTDPLRAFWSFYCVGGFYNDLWDLRSARECWQQGLASPLLARSQRRDMSSLLGLAALWLGDLPAARQFYAETGFSPLMAFFEGDWERERDLLKGALEWACKVHLGFEIFVRRSLACVLRALGEHPRACVVLERFLQNYAPGEPICKTEMYLRPELALLYTELGRLESAREQVAGCDEITAAGENWRGLGAHSERAAAVLAAAEGRHSDADARFATSAGVFNRLSLVWEEADVLHRWGRAIASAGEDDRAIEKLAAATEIYRRHGAGQRWIDHVAADRSRIEDSTRREPRATPAPDATRGVFRREGEYWTIAYRDRLIRLKDMKGLRYIAYLLAHPSEQFHVRDLVTTIAEVTAAGAQGPDLRADGLAVVSDLGHAGEMLDSKARSELRQRVTELRAELADADEMHDMGRAERARTEMDFVTHQLSAAFGLGGRERKSSDHAERMRSRVGRAIRASISAIREQDPALGHHFATCIRTGYLCAYLPDPEALPTWLL